MTEHRPAIIVRSLGLFAGTVILYSVLATIAYAAVNALAGGLP